MELKVDNAAIETLVRDQLRIAVSEALTKRAPDLVNAMVTEVLKKPDYNNSRKSTVETLLEQSVIKAAQEEIQAWVEAQRPAIRAEIGKRLNAKKSPLVTQICDQLVAGLGTGLRVTVTFANDSRY